MSWGRVTVVDTAPSWLQPLTRRLEIRWFDRVTEIELYGTDFNNASIQDLHRLERLDRLAISRTYIDEDGLEPLLDRFPQLDLHVQLQAEMPFVEL